jgi:hypothetical protein
MGTIRCVVDDVLLVHLKDGMNATLHEQGDMAIGTETPVAHQHVGGMPFRMQFNNRLSVLNNRHSAAPRWNLRNSWRWENLLLGGELMEHTYRSQTFDHRGLVAGLCDERGLGDGLDNATQQHPERRDLTGGEAVKALGLHGLGWIKPTLDLVPRVFQHTPTSRLRAPRVLPAQLNDAALGRAVDTLDNDGVTALDSLIAATAATRLG